MTPTERALRAADRSAYLNCFTDLLAAPARADAARVDPALPLAGMPFAAKNLFDVAGVTTLAGSEIHRDDAPATRDAAAVARLKAAGAVLVGLTNMDEFAYGFSTENAHHGATRNPHDPDRIAGGSSGGSAAAVAAGIVPVALGSDTNGSIRVPASLCGIYGLKPTFGRVSRAGSFPFVASLDHVGHFARTVHDLTAAYDVLQGHDPADPASIDRPAPPVLPGLDADLPPLRIGILGGWFAQGATPEARAAVDHVAAAFADVRAVTLEGAEAARSAAFCLTGIEGASLHLANLHARPLDFDPAVRDRLLAGALLPAGLLPQIRRVRRLFKEEADRLFATVDVLLTPATPCSAPRIGEAMVRIDGRDVPVRANLGLYTQPISFIGLPALSVPVRLPGLPIGVQMIAGPWAEATLLRAAAFLERGGRIASATPPTRAETAA